MKRVLLLVLGAGLLFAQSLLAGDTLPPDEAARRVAAGTAVLIDVREPGEWEGGVVRGALLLPLGDLQGARSLWAGALKTHADKELILYCRSGNRAGIAARLLARENFRVANAGAFAAWKDAGQAVEKPAR
jgi:rhodanese-related sulfurtransferase